MTPHPVADAERLRYAAAVPNPSPPPPDPFAIWREWVSQSERQWNAALNQAMGSDQFSQAMGRFMGMAAEMQRGVHDALGRTLTALNLPTRTDMLALGDRLAALEDRLARIEGVLRASSPGNGAAGAEAAVPRPPRTRRPPPPEAPEPSGSRGGA